LLDKAKCLELFGQMRWPRGSLCPKRGGGRIARYGHDGTQKLRQRYVCRIVMFASAISPTPFWPGIVSL
jgi:hypothetical protein